MWAVAYCRVLTVGDGWAGNGGPPSPRTTGEDLDWDDWACVLSGCAYTPWPATVGRGEGGVLWLLGVQTLGGLRPFAGAL